jgi:DMSO/TMAO reductase YedYZ molybdopterin-dependent catalytic subunit
MPDADVAVEQQIRRMTRRSFLWGAGAGLAGFAGWAWLRTRGQEGGIPWPLRRALEINERLAQGTFRSGRLAPAFARETARQPRVNGGLGLTDALDPAAWQLRVERPAEAAPVRTLTLDDVKALPRVEMVTELKCVEGWSVVVHWAGARFSDFAARHGPAGLPLYVGLETPDGGYYVGLDRPSALHPQTLLCYEMNGTPLTPEHGAPLRLVTAVKYGFKSLKRIGTIRFTDQRPADYWAERGYDWYAGH